MRYLIITIFLLMGGLISCQNNTQKNADFVPVFEDLFKSSTDTLVSCYRIPSIITAPNGDLIVAVDERVPSCGDLKYNDNINIVIRRSEDNGQTWSEIERIVDYPIGQSASDPSMVVDKSTGTLFLFFNFMDLKKEQGVFYLRYISSTDNGKTWSKASDITSQITKEQWKNDFKFITSGRGLQLKDGTLLHTLVNLERGLFLFGSKDNGVSWFLIDVPIPNADESKVMELSEGTLMINSRVNGRGYRTVYLSKDKGNTWESKVDSTLIDPSCNASLLRYTFKNDYSKKPLLLFSNAKHQNKRENMSIRWSDDNGASWSKGKTIYPHSSAYSSMTVLKNGDIGLFFEKDDYTTISFVRLPLDYIMD